MMESITPEENNSHPPGLGTSKTETSVAMVGDLSSKQATASDEKVYITADDLDRDGGTPVVKMETGVTTPTPTAMALKASLKGELVFDDSGAEKATKGIPSRLAARLALGAGERRLQSSVDKSLPAADQTSTNESKSSKMKKKPFTQKKKISKLSVNEDMLDQTVSTSATITPMSGDASLVTTPSNLSFTPSTNGSRKFFGDDQLFHGSAIKGRNIFKWKHLTVQTPDKKTGAVNTRAQVHIFIVHDNPQLGATVNAQLQQTSSAKMKVMLESKDDQDRVCIIVGDLVYSGDFDCVEGALENIKNGQQTRGSGCLVATNLRAARAPIKKFNTRPKPGSEDIMEIDLGGPGATEKLNPEFVVDVTDTVKFQTLMSSCRNRVEVILDPINFDQRWFPYWEGTRKMAPQFRSKGIGYIRLGDDMSRFGTAFLSIDGGRTYMDDGLCTTATATATAAAADDSTIGFSGSSTVSSIVDSSSGPLTSSSRRKLARHLSHGNSADMSPMADDCEYSPEAGGGGGGGSSSTALMSQTAPPQILSSMSNRDMSALMASSMGAPGGTATDCQTGPKSLSGMEGKRTRGIRRMVSNSRLGVDAAEDGISGLMSPGGVDSQAQMTECCSGTAASLRQINDHLKEDLKWAERAQYIGKIGNTLACLSTPSHLSILCFEMFLSKYGSLMSDSFNILSDTFSKQKNPHVLVASALCLKVITSGRASVFYNLGMSHNGWRCLLLEAFHVLRSGNKQVHETTSQTLTFLYTELGAAAFGWEHVVIMLPEIINGRGASKAPTASGSTKGGAASSSSSSAAAAAEPGSGKLKSGAAVAANSARVIAWLESAMKFDIDSFISALLKLGSTSNASSVLKKLDCMTPARVVFPLLSHREEGTRDAAVSLIATLVVADVLMNVSSFDLFLSFCQRVTSSSSSQVGNSPIEAHSNAIVDTLSGGLSEEGRRFLESCGYIVANQNCTPFTPGGGQGASYTSSAASSSSSSSASSSALAPRMLERLTSAMVKAVASTALSASLHSAAARKAKTEASIRSPPPSGSSVNGSSTASTKKSQGVAAEDDDDNSANSASLPVIQSISALMRHRSRSSSGSSIRCIPSHTSSPPDYKPHNDNDLKTGDGSSSSAAAAANAGASAGTVNDVNEGSPSPSVSSSGDKENKTSPRSRSGTDDDSYRSAAANVERRLWEKERACSEGDDFSSTGDSCSTQNSASTGLNPAKIKEALSLLSNADRDEDDSNNQTLQKRYTGKSRTKLGRTGSRGSSRGNSAAAPLNGSNGMTADQNSFLQECTDASLITTGGDSSIVVADAHDAVTKTDLMSALADSWFEAKLLLKDVPKSENEWHHLIKVMKHSHEFFSELDALAKAQKCAVGTLTRLILPFDEETSSNDQSKLLPVTPRTGDFLGGGSPPKPSVSGRGGAVGPTPTHDNAVMKLRAQAVDIRQLIRVKMADEADFKQASAATLQLDTFLGKLCAAAAGSNVTNTIRKVDQILGF